MKTFVNILLGVALVILAIKLGPVLLGLALAGLAIAAVLGTVGLALLGVLVTVLLGIILALSPIWIPVLAIIGLVNLFKSTNSGNAPVPPAAATV
jgi:hypothetical protein